MTEKSIIFFDIDGTLLDHDKKLPLTAKEAIFSLKDLGHEVAIATGRAPFMFADLREELEIDTFVSYNGQYVVLNGQVLYKNPLDQEALHSLTELALKNDHPIVFMDHEDMKANVAHHDYIVESMESLKIAQFPSHDPLYHEDRDIYQSLLFLQDQEETIYEEEYKQFDFIRWHPLSIDVIPAGGSKAIGIDKITTELGIHKGNQYAFGDGLNDIEMLRQITNSVAMGNAHPSAKQAAAFVTSSVDEDGILQGLKKVGLLK
ncbi:Cof-type HAD-IIB family hydrolase [Alkalihalobacillus sp. MEB130]|uniref:Cof-type HAD-IIB family hydrolase n=1 Tax=Alkalihalobacillus sp. MEB130 TaxID=2976704 RepID=UPI0028DD44AB|nr:Cof-type HAD-IIB family hydrolase [Alkalihalobacillus sp. MEB130]MDT8861628.1 Cof-type HAD-IIB family hydrolase [Alkalihalobacillus sp. MEB130]